MSINIAHIGISIHQWSQNLGSIALYKYQILFLVIVRIILLGIFFLIGEGIKLS